MRLAIVVATMLAVASAAPQPDSPSDGFGDTAAPPVTVSVEDVRHGATYTLDTMLQGGITGLADRSINGLKGVALTVDEKLIGLLDSIHAVMLGTIPDAMRTILVDDSNYQTLRHVLCFTDNWSFQLDTIHKYATLAHNNIECDAGLLSKPIANKLVRTADGVFVNRDYYNYIVCYIRDQVAVARTLYNFLLTKLADKDCTSYYKAEL